MPTKGILLKRETRTFDDFLEPIQSKGRHWDTSIW